MTARAALAWMLAAVVGAGVGAVVGAGVGACRRSVDPADPAQPAGPRVGTQALPASRTTPAAATPAPETPPDPSAWARLGAARPGDWRHRFPGDTPMSFDAYVGSDPVRADGDRRVLAFLPAGPFDAEQRAALDAAAEFAGLWFDLPVRVLDPVNLTDDAAQYRDRAGGMRQYRTRWFLYGLLPDRRPRDAIVLLGVTMADLWPGRDWNYVFGEADLRRGVGVWSLARYFPDFWGARRDEASLRLALLRTLKVVVHEAGHTFGLEHCVTWECAMNGSNSLDETDRQPLRLCPDCLRKLSWNRGFDVAARYAKLAEFLDGHGLAEEAAWHRARAAERGAK